MKKKMKGFTLIELLAIIVILAIIAVITVPIILNVIDNAKKGTAKDSVYGYKDAISKYYVTEMLEENAVTLNGTYTVDSNGVLTKGTETHEIMFSGTKPKEGYLTYTNNVLTEGCLTIDDYKVAFINGEVTNVERGECGQKVAYKCIRATELHTEECTQTSDYCYAAGYTEAGSKGTTTITYGNTTVTQGTLTSGDVFDCDVNGDGKYDSQFERFYYVSDLYNTTSKQFDNNYAVLIYYNNTTNGQADNTLASLIAYYSDSDDINYEGPVTAITNLPTTEQWPNVNLSNNFHAILNQNNEGTSGNGTKVLPTAFSYEGYAARFLTTQEVNVACNITVGSSIEAELDNCNYLLENTTYADPINKSHGYWLNTARKASTGSVWRVRSRLRYINYDVASKFDSNGVRPAIEVLKTDIEI